MLSALAANHSFVWMLTSYSRTTYVGLQTFTRVQHPAPPPVNTQYS